VWLLGLVIVYGRVTVGIDVDLTEGAWRRRLNEARRRVVEPGDDAHAAVEHTQPPSSPMRDLPSGETPPWAPTTTPEFAKPPMGVTPSAAAPVGGGEPPARTLHCPSCAAVCSTEDLFCGGCGQRLR